MFSYPQGESLYGAPVVIDLGTFVPTDHRPKGDRNALIQFRNIGEAERTISWIVHVLEPQNVHQNWVALATEDDRIVWRNLIYAGSPVRARVVLDAEPLEAEKFGVLRERPIPHQQISIPPTEMRRLMVEVQREKKRLEDA